MFSSGRRYQMRHGIGPLIYGQNVVGRESRMTMTEIFSSRPKDIY
jgi:hypothetical protein